LSSHIAAVLEWSAKISPYAGEDVLGRLDFAACRKLVVPTELVLEVALFLTNLFLCELGSYALAPISFSLSRCFVWYCLSCDDLWTVYMTSAGIVLSHTLLASGQLLHEIPLQTISVACSAALGTFNLLFMFARFAAYELRELDQHPSEIDTSHGSREALPTLLTGARISLPSITYGNLSSKGEASPKICPTCTICLEEFLDEDVVSSLPCGHCYHRKCVMPWLESGSSVQCPMRCAPFLKREAWADTEPVENGQTRGVYSALEQLGSHIREAAIAMAVAPADLDRLGHMLDNEVYSVSDLWPHAAVREDSHHNEP